MIKQVAKGIDLHSSAFAKEMKLTRWQMTTINFLDKQPGQMVKQRVIEEEFAIKRSTTSSSAWKRGGLELVKLTNEAKDLLPGIQEEIKDDDLELLRHFSQEHEEINTVRRLLKYIAEEG